MNLYWPVYKKIEEEVIKLADIIHFSDDQLSVYSVGIADLIVRCAIEIESISKELYIRLEGDVNPKDSNGDIRDLYFDTDCIKLLNEQWHLDKKAIKVKANNMHFIEHVELYPMKKSEKRGSSGSKWKKAYQALKHDRYGSLKQGNISNMLDALGALYILNVYYADVDYIRGMMGFSPLIMRNEFDSDIFEAYVSSALEIEWGEEVSDNSIIWNEDDELDKSIFILKISDDDFQTQHFGWNFIQRKREHRFYNNKEIKKYLKANKDKDRVELSMEAICFDAGGPKLANEIMGDREERWVEHPKVQVIVNKNKRIYPHLQKADDKILGEMISDYFFYSSESI